MDIETLKSLLDVFPKDYTVFAKILKPIPEGSDGVSISGVEADHEKKQIIIR